MNMRTSASVAVSSSAKKRSIPPQNDSMDFPRSHHVTNRAVMNSPRLLRIGIETTETTLAQHARMIALTGTSSSTRLAAISQTPSPAPHANLMSASWNIVGKKTMVRIVLTRGSLRLMMTHPLDR